MATAPDDQSAASQRAGITRFTQVGDATCHRCHGGILDGSYAGRVQAASRAPWATGTLLCSDCADRLEERYGNAPGISRED
jgi:hypothetical protein